MVGPTSFVFPVSFCVKYLDQCFSSCKQGKDLGICTMVEHSVSTKGLSYAASQLWALRTSAKVGINGPRTDEFMKMKYL